MESFFDKIVVVSMKQTDREDRRARLRINITFRQSTSSSHSKELAVRITEEDDPCFLYHLALGEEDFQNLKNQQGLLVDFGAFPQKFVDLLEICSTEESKDVPKFLLQFVVSGGLDQGLGSLNVVETNPFKHLVHLSLRFLPGNDTEIKKYLASCLLSLKNEKLALDNRLATTETDLRERLHSCQEVLSSRTKDLEALRAEFAAKSGDLSAKHAQEITAERERTLQIKSSTQQQYEREKKAIEESKRDLVRKLESQLAEADSHNKELMERKYQAESTIRELKTRLSGIEEEYHHMKQELHKLRRQNGALDSERHEHNKTLNHLRTRTAVLEQEVKDKEQIISRTNELLEAANEHRKKQEESLEERQQQITKLEAAVKSISGEVFKGNEIIQRMQSELLSFKSKMKLKNVVTAKQEKLLAEKDATLEKQKKELETIQRNNQEKDDEVKKLSSSLESTMEKLEESKELLKTNENVINWLNKQMNEQMVTQQRYGPFEMHSKFSTRDNGRPPLSVSNSGTSVDNQTLVPRFPKQVLYKSSFPRTAGLPPPISQSTPTAPEPAFSAAAKSSPVFPAGRGGTSSRDRENEPVLDAKYLQRREPGAEGATQRDRIAPPVATQAPRLATVPEHQQPPLMSAYFPKTSGAT